MKSVSTSNEAIKSFLNNVNYTTKGDWKLMIDEKKLPNKIAKENKRKLNQSKGYNYRKLFVTFSRHDNQM